MDGGGVAPSEMQVHLKRVELYNIYCIKYNIVM